MAADQTQVAVFARRTIDLVGGQSILVKFYAPVKEESGAHRCEYEIAFPDRAIRRYAYGVDDVHALRLAMYIVEVHLLCSDEGRAGALTFLGDANLGLTIEETWAQPDYSKRAHATPLLLFDGQAADAMAFYVSLFDDHEILVDDRYGSDESGPAGRVKRAVFRIAFQNFICADVVDERAASSTPAMSISIECVNEAEIVRLAKALSERGSILRPLGANAAGGHIAWVRDRFGVSWRLNST